MNRFLLVLVSILLVFIVVLCLYYFLKQPNYELGKSIYVKNCKVCHAQGINGAPIVGNEKMWSKRKEQSMLTLIQHAKEGFGLMPPKGGNDDLTELELELAIDYMLSELK